MVVFIRAISAGEQKINIFLINIREVNVCVQGECCYATATKVFSVADLRGFLGCHGTPFLSGMPSFSKVMIVLVDLASSAVHTSNRYSKPHVLAGKPM